MALTQTQVSQLYVSIFNRASEGNGNTYWQSGADLATVATQMLATTDAATYFGTSLNTNQAFVEHIYLNTLNKTTADDAAGIAYWVAELDSGVSRGQMVANLVTAATLAANAGAAQDQFNNRVTVSNYMADTVAATPADYATSTSFSSGLTVTSDAATVTTAKTTVDSISEDASAGAGQIFALTNSFNQTTGGIDFKEGTDKDDTFIASVSATASNSTYSVGDIIDGGAGYDTLDVSTTADTDAVTVSAIEKILVRNTSAATIEFDATSITDLEIITSNKSKAAVDITGVQSLSTKVGAYSTDQDLYFGFSNAITSGSEDAVTVELDTVGTTTTNVNVYTENVEVMNLVSKGTSKNYLGEVASDADNDNTAITGAEKLTKLVITGSAELRIATDLDAGITEIDASAATGNVRLGQEAATSTIKTGSGNDRINVGVAANLTTADTIDGGAGTDSIVIADGFTTALTKVTNIEIIRTADTVNGGADTYDMSTIESVNEVIFADDTNGDNHNITNGEGKFGAVVDMSGALVYTDKTNKASATFNLDNGEKLAKDNGVDIASLVTDSVETLTINSVGGMLLADTTNLRTGLNANSVVIGNGTQVATVKITGNTDVEVDATLETDAATFDASAHTGNVSLTVDTAKTKTITMGAGNDLVALGGVAADAYETVNLGAGNDTLSMEFADLTTNDSLTGGEGTDTLSIADDMDVGTLAKSAVLASVSGFEKISMADNKTLTLSDAAISSLGGSSVTVTRAATGTNATTIVASAVTQGNTTITVDGSNVTTTGYLVYTGSNAIDNFTGTLNADAVFIDSASLKSTDSFNGAAGADVFTLDVINASTTLTTAVTAAQLTNVKSFSNIYLSDNTNAGNKISITLDNNFVDNNASSNALTIKALDTNGATASNDKVTVDASAVTSNVSLTLIGGSVVDTLKGGAGDDEISGGSDGDTLTGGTGKDDFNFASTGTPDAISDMDFGTNTGTANVDQIDISGLAAAMGGAAFTFAGAFDSIQKDSAAATAAATVDVIIMDTQTYADATAAETAMTAQVAASNNDIIVIWADSFNVVHVSIDDDRDTDTGTGLLDIATLTGATLSGVYAALDTADFIIA